MEPVSQETNAEFEQVRQQAARYHFDFVDLRDCRPDGELLRSIPLDMMLHYQFLPLEAHDHQLVIVVGDPTDLSRLDELEMKLDRQLVIRVAPPSQVRDFLKKTEPSQRVLDEATEEFRLDVISDEEAAGRRALAREPGRGAGSQPHDPAGGFDHLCRAGAARQ